MMSSNWRSESDREVDVGGKLQFSNARPMALRRVCGKPKSLTCLSQSWSAITIEQEVRDSAPHTTSLPTNTSLVVGGERHARKMSRKMRGEIAPLAPHSSSDEN